MKESMRSLLKIISSIVPHGGHEGLLAGPVAAVAIASGLSLVTLTASLYMFNFAGRGLLPPPPTPDLAISRTLEPVPIRATSIAEPLTTPAPAQAVPEPALPAALLADTSGTASNAGTAAAAVASGDQTVAPSIASKNKEDDDEDHGNNKRGGGHQTANSSDSSVRTASSSSSGDSGSGGSDATTSKRKSSKD